MSVKHGVIYAAEADDMEGGAAPAKRIKVEGGWSGQSEHALPSGACLSLPCAVQLLSLLQKHALLVCACVSSTQLFKILHCIPLLSGVRWD